MGESRPLISRREILKRGAIVGGGILWVAPIVQTLGMGSAYAAAVSGEAPCPLTLEYVVCRPSSGKQFVDFEVSVPDGCACYASSGDYDVILSNDREPGTGLWEPVTMDSFGSGVYRAFNLAVWSGDPYVQTTTARCVRRSDGTVVGVSNQLVGWVECPTET